MLRRKEKRRQHSISKDVSSYCTFSQNCCSEIISGCQNMDLSSHFLTHRIALAGFWSDLWFSPITSRAAMCVKEIVRLLFVLYQLSSSVQLSTFFSLCHSSPCSHHVLGLPLVFIPSTLVCSTMFDTLSGSIFNRGPNNHSHFSWIFHTRIIFGPSHFLSTSFFKYFAFLKSSPFSSTHPFL